ncbi:MAG TPA: hypothetical protein VI454_03770, partial [Verrucomicrobiae bacterium]
VPSLDRVVPNHPPPVPNLPLDPFNPRLDVLNPRPPVPNLRVEVRNEGYPVRNISADALNQRPPVRNIDGVVPEVGADLFDLGVGALKSGRMPRITEDGPRSMFAGVTRIRRVVSGTALRRQEVGAGLVPVESAG